ncbi:MAG: VOC family protein [Cytophagales bacterium]|nr:VOC family protein [Cytophagales bacterium]
MSDKEPKITGIGGVFFKSQNSISLKNWYAKSFSLNVDEYGALFEARQSTDPEKMQYLQWGPFKQDTTYFDPSQAAFMINYRVQNIEGLVEKLRNEGVTIVDEIETFEYGKFVHVMDPEGNKLELWEPVDEVFEKEYSERANKE